MGEREAPIQVVPDPDRTRVNEDSICSSLIGAGRDKDGLLPPWTHSVPVMSSKISAIPGKMNICLNIF